MLPRANSRRVAPDACLELARLPPLLDLDETAVGLATALARRGMALGVLRAQPLRARRETLRKPSQRRHHLGAVRTQRNAGEGARARARAGSSTQGGAQDGFDGAKTGFISFAAGVIVLIASARLGVPLQTACIVSAAGIITGLSMGIAMDKMYNIDKKCSQAREEGKGGGAHERGKEEKKQARKALGDKEVDGAVMVVGASGMLGREVVKAMRERGKNVVAAARTAEKAEQALEGVASDEGLALRTNVDVTNPDTLDASLFRGVEHIVCTLGPILGEREDGSREYMDGMSPEKVDREGVANVAQAAKRFLGGDAGSRQTTKKRMIDFTDAGELDSWRNLDDGVMGGKSTSGWRKESNGCSTWSGTIVTDGGGFCGTARDGIQDDLSGFDGLYITCAGQGERYKVTLRTTDTASKDESVYQQSFVTDQSGGLVTCKLPFSGFVAVQRAQEDPDAPGLNPAGITSVGLKASRFEVNNLPNATLDSGGDFALSVAEIGAYAEPRPRLLTFSSCGTERNARIRTQEERQKEIPIVRLNPAGVLNHKYGGECSVRASGLPYFVLRMTGLTTVEEQEEGLVPVELHQGDAISGRISRAEAARIAALAIDSPSACGKTIDARRCTAESDLAASQPDAAISSLIGYACEDADRPRWGFKPLPAFKEPGPEPSEEERQAVLQDERVQNAVQRGLGGRVRDASQEEQPEQVN